eukprot:126043_1
MTQILIRTSREQIKLHMKFDSNDHTVFDVKKAFCDEHGINSTPDKIMLRNKGKKLQPDSASLASVGIKGKIEMLTMSFIIMGGGGGVTQIVIRTATKQVRLRTKFGPNYTVFDVKKAYCDENGINVTPDKIILRQKAKILQPDSASLASVGVKGKIVMLTVSYKLRGGGGVPGSNINNDHVPDYRVVVQG